MLFLIAGEDILNLIYWSGVDVALLGGSQPLRTARTAGRWSVNPLGMIIDIIYQKFRLTIHTTRSCRCVADSMVVLGPCKSPNQP